MSNKIKLNVEIEAPQWFLDLVGKALKGADVTEDKAGKALAKPAGAAVAGKPTLAKPAAKKPAKAAPAEEEEDDGGFGEPSGSGDDKTLDDVKVALQRYAAQEGKPAAVELLKTYSTNNMNKLKPEQFGEIVAEIEGLLEEQAA